MNEQELKEYLLKMVQEFCSKRNEIEKFVIEKNTAQDLAFSHFSSDAEKINWLKENPQINWFDEFIKLLSPLVDTYCTDKNRVYGRKHGYPLCFLVTFDGIENPIETSIEIKNKNCAEVYIKTNTKFKDEYLFVLCRKYDQWKIDNYKRRYDNKKWDNQIL